MARKMISLRLDEDLLARADAFAKARGSNRTALVEEALVSLMAEVEHAQARPPVPVIPGVGRARDVRASQRMERTFGSPAAYRAWLQSQEKRS